MKKFYNNRVLTTYFIIQPIIDIITGLMKYYFDLPLSLAMIVRFMFILYCGLYLIVSKNKKVYAFFGIWFAYFLVSIVGNYIIKDNFSIVHHAYNLFRLIYFQIVLLFFYLYLKKHKSIDNQTFTKMGFIVGISLLISLLTKTSFCSYDEFENCLPKGYLGYFFSANEYGSILIALLGYQMIEFIKKRKLINLVVLSMLVLFLSLLGTKTSFIGLFGLFFVYIIYYLITAIFITPEKRDYRGAVVVMFLIIVLVGVNIKRLPVYNNLYEIYFGTLETKTNENPEINDKDLKKEVNNYLVFSGRNDFIAVNKEIYKNAPLFNKLFGITDQGNYYNEQLVNHINERDFHDLYMIYGIVGLIVESLLPLYLGIRLLKKLNKNVKLLLNDEIIILCITLGLLLMVSYMAGHSLMHPAVAFYIAYIINDLLKKVAVS
ncbi:MAG: O-antigen ligase family protein [Bacilli bacterium]|nr:O-antigen ligase family protein [Bacilli bacterium]